MKFCCFPGCPWCEWVKGPIMHEQFLEQFLPITLNRIAKISIPLTFHQLPFIRRQKLNFWTEGTPNFRGYPRILNFLNFDWRQNGKLWGCRNTSNFWKRIILRKVTAKTKPAKYLNRTVLAQLAESMQLWAHHERSWQTRANPPVFHMPENAKKVERVTKRVRHIIAI